MNTNFVNYLVAKKSSKNTIDAYVKAVNDCLGFIGKDDENITSMDLVNWMASISHMSTASVAMKLSGVKSYFKMLKMYGIIESNPAIDIEVPSIKNKEKHYMDADMISAMLSHCRNIRDNAVILAYATTGMRHSELSSLTVSQWKDMLANGMNYITITGKGDKERNVYFNQQTIDTINKYLRWRRVDSEWLFASNEGNQIARNNMSHMLKTTAARAGIPFANDISNHAMRAAAASIMSERNVPVAVIRDTLGHSSISVTSRYIKTNASQMASANAAMTF